MSQPIDISEVRKVKAEDRRSTATVFDNLLTIKDLSKFLNVPEATIRDWVYKKKIPFRKLGRLIRFHPLDIQKWLEERSRYGN